MKVSYAIDGARAGQARQALTNGDSRPLSQAAAADRLGIHPVTLNRIENGKARVSLELLERMCDLYGRSREWLLGEPEQVDDFDARRARFAAALEKLAAGFEEIQDVLMDGVRDAKVPVGS